MIARNYRLDRARIAHLLKKGGLIRSQFFIVKYFENSGEFCRFCVIISAKIDGKAVIRNHLRRRTYEAIRTLPHPSRKFDLALIAKKSLKEAGFAEIKSDLQNLFKTLNE